jgi:hypothetical protein
MTPMLTEESVLEVDQVTKAYPSPTGPVRVLESIDLRLAPGERATVMGPILLGLTRSVQIAPLSASVSKIPAASIAAQVVWPCAMPRRYRVAATPGRHRCGERKVADQRECQCHAGRCF